ncbi:glycosyltransferase family 2 protein [Herbaspirillum robiniae]|uniref:Glycosyltransferase family 2 protein n=1 Tax=Herbaspirillum robiniae TaxID=2014887 RepID=A0ABX2M1E7_9BURK|nr:glycosyltransferase family 2 protein [Herbaspirillum robiniae]NUU03205.1 glycosyltransferase family 2 protein [Herbaspirillum robiniae]
MSTTPLVTVVMPAYNAAGYIVATIGSVLNQSFTDYELLVINDCSKDNTADIVNKFAAADSRIRLINLPANKGAPAGPRNIGIQQARGKWIAFLDSDDLWHPAKLERQIDLLEKTGARFCSTRMMDFIDPATLNLSDAAPEDHEWISFTQQLIKFRTPTSSVVAERALMLNNPFNEDMSFKAREDLDCWLHCHEEIGRSVKITVPMMGYRIIPGQISGKKWVMFRRHLHVLKQYRFRSGRKMGLGAWVFTFTHFALAVYHRNIKKSL